MSSERPGVIYCPQCGTANREGSRFCNNCGHNLSAAEQELTAKERSPSAGQEVTCPACGHRNPREAASCSNCGATLPSAAAPEKTEPVPEEVPTWLKRLRDLEGAEGDEGGERVPTWLLRLRQEGLAPKTDQPSPTEPSPEPPVPQPPPPEEPAPEVPSAAPIEREPPVVEPPAPAPETLEPEVPRPEPRIPEEAPPEPLPERPPERTTRIDLARLEEGLPAEPPPPPSEGIPPEVAAAPEPIPPEEAVEPAPSEGLLAGLAGVLSEQAAFPRPRRRRPTIAVPLAGTEQASVFEDVVTGPTISAPPEDEEKPRRLSPTLVRWLIYLLVGGAVILAILLSGILPSGLAPGATAYAFDEAISAIPEQATVLVSFDYDPATRGELGPQASAVLRRLVERDARILAVSLLPEGASLADEALEGSAAHAGYVYGQDYLNLGFISGLSAGARALTQGLLTSDQTEYRDGQQLSETEIGEGITGLTDVDLIVVLSDRPEALRRWIEQVQTPSGIEMVAGVSAQADPFARPYLTSGQLQGLLVGLLGAAELETLTGVAGRGISAVAPQSLGHLAVLVVILGANLAHLWGRLRGTS